jgi:DegV family protein with EDD domain
VPGEEEQSAAGPPERPVAVVTDSSASLPSACRSARVARAARPLVGMRSVAPVTIVPLRVLSGDQMADDDDPGFAAVLEAAAGRDERLSTARPSPDRFAAVYRAAAEQGAAGVLSVHLSGLLSGTVSSAALAAASAPIPVRVLDGRGIGTGLGLVVLAAAAAARAGHGLDAVAAMAIRRAEGVGSYFAVDRPEALLAGGRMAAGPSPACVGAADRLVSRTVLQIQSGRVVVIERVRTKAVADDLLVRLATDQAAAVAAAGPAGSAVDVAVEYTSAPHRAAELARRLAGAIPHIGRLYVTRSSTAIRVHTGLGMVGVSVAPCATES